MASSLAFSPKSVPLTVFHKNRLESVALELGAPLATSSPVRRTFCSPLVGIRSGSTTTRRRPARTEDTYLAELMEELHLNDTSLSRTPLANSQLLASDGYSSGSTTSPSSSLGRLSPINSSMRELRNELNSFVSESFHCSGTYQLAQSVNHRSQPEQDIPRFYFPQGRPVAKEENDKVCRRVLDIFNQLPSGKCRLSDMPVVCRAAELPVYLKIPMFNLMTRGEDRDAISDDFVFFWTEMTRVANDGSTRFVFIVSQGRVDYVTREVFEPILMDIVLTHPGMTFLANAVELHSQYCEIISTAIFWFLGKAFSEFLTTEDIRQSDLVHRLFQMELIDDINISRNYFGYMHFYVVSSHFYVVDTDHDMLIDRCDMEKYDGKAIPADVIDGIFSERVCGGRRKYIGLREFTHFLLADEDKTHPMSQTYWMRVLDSDGMTYLTIERMELLHHSIQLRMIEEDIEYLDFRDKLCNIIDALKPSDFTRIRLSDLRRNPQIAPMILNSLVNWKKFVAQECKEDFDAARISADGELMSPWDIFCDSFSSSQSIPEVSSLNSSEGSML